MSMHFFAEMHANLRWFVAQVHSTWLRGTWLVKVSVIWSHQLHRNYRSQIWDHSGLSGSKPKGWPHLFASYGYSGYNTVVMNLPSVHPSPPTEVKSDFLGDTSLASPHALPPYRQPEPCRLGDHLHAATRVNDWKTLRYVWIRYIHVHKNRCTRYIS